MQNHAPANSAYIRPGTPGDVVNLCIGGRIFITRRATLYRLPDSRLYMIATQGDENCRVYKDEAQASNACDRKVRTDVDHTTTPGEYTVGGATLLPNQIVTSLYGKKNLISAAAVCRNKVYPSIDSPDAQTRHRESNMYQSSPINDNATVPQPVYFFDRDPEIFRFVLDYYRTGELHLPTNICGPFVRKELIFWGIDESLIDPCCMPAYMRYDEEKRTKKTLFRDCFEDIDSMQNLVKFSRGWKKWRYRLWLFMDHPTSSYVAKMWAMLLIVLMIASVLSYCFSTSPIFRKPAYAGKSLINNPHYAKFYNISNWADDALDICDDTVNLNNPKIIKDCFTEPIPALVIFDMTLNCIFTAEFMLKVLLAPDKHKFLSSIVSIIDVIILVTYWIYIALFYFYYYNKKPSSLLNMISLEKPPNNLWLLNILSMTQSMRILRIFKMSKISRGLRVLILTVKKSIPELVLLAFLLMNGMFMFSCMIYMAEYSVNETFTDIPQAFWWSIITLTTVGYGDTYPRGTAGYVIGSIAAVSGCIVTGLAIPIIGNNFNTYYMYMKNQLKEDKYLKELRKDINSTGVGNILKGLGGLAEKTGLPMLHRKYRQFRADKQYTVGNRVVSNANSNAKRDAHFEAHAQSKTGLKSKQKLIGRKFKVNRLRKIFPSGLFSDNMKKELLHLSVDPSIDNPPNLAHSEEMSQFVKNSSQNRFSMELSNHCDGLHPSLLRRTSTNLPLATDVHLDALSPSFMQSSTRSDNEELREQSEIYFGSCNNNKRSMGRSNGSCCIPEPDNCSNSLINICGHRSSGASSGLETTTGLFYPDFPHLHCPIFESNYQLPPPLSSDPLASIMDTNYNLGLKRDYI